MKTIKILLVAIIAITSITANAQTWSGTWNSTFGELRLQQIGTKVYGDYRDLGDVEGTISGNKLTGTFTNGSNTGNFEWTRSNDDKAFSGKWKWSTSNSWETWNGTLKSAVVPGLTSMAARDKKFNHLRGVTGSQNMQAKFTYADFGDRKSNPNEFSIFGLASANLHVVENGQSKPYKSGPRIMHKSEGSAEKTRRTASGVKLINFNKDFNMTIYNKDILDPEKTFVLVVNTDFKSKGIFSNSDFGNRKMDFDVLNLSPTQTYSVKASEGNLISNLYFTIRKTN